jgi:hypothetical protein
MLNLIPYFTRLVEVDRVGFEFTTFDAALAFLIDPPV